MTYNEQIVLMMKVIRKLEDKLDRLSQGGYDGILSQEEREMERNRLLEQWRIARSGLVLVVEDSYKAA